ncbi:protoheme IX farnesyltransferase [Saccharicrinis sp. FJH2]|uniref:protoheme IX farnesyltransferase n=1 Tax=Saccharicrinis sp. FJH65 TaxID=3344659 RepID=UPI0035F4A39D
MERNKTSYFHTILVLMKHRLSMTVAFSSVVGWFLFSSEISFGILALYLGTFFLAGGSSAMNQYQERELDKMMGRTKNRPLPSGILSAPSAFSIALLLMLLGTLILFTFNNITTAALGILNAVIYNLIYTKLKTKTQYAVLPGAIVGAIPPMMGWAAAGGDIMQPQIVYFAMFMFLWQMPHFWLLVIKYGKEYEKAGFSILSGKIDEQKIKRLVFFWGAITSAYLLAFPLFFKHASLLVMIALMILNIGFIIGFYRILYKPKEEKRSTIKAFLFINSYALLVMILFIANSFI